MPVPPSRSGFVNRRNVAVLRSAGFVAAVVLGALAVWLIVTSESKKSLEIGILTGLWGLLLGTYAVFGSRVPVRDPQPPLAPAPPPPPTPPPARELDVRTIGEIERAAVAAARREFHDELQLLLRREVHAGVAQEVSSLRAEVTALRNELLEKVGGQLRLERIETTRLIGSDLEAVQSELRMLRQTTVDGDHAPSKPAVPVIPPVPPASPPAEDDDEIQDAEIVPDEPTVELPVAHPAASVNGIRVAELQLPRLAPPVSGPRVAELPVPRPTPPVSGPRVAEPPLPRSAAPVNGPRDPEPPLPRSTPPVNGPRAAEPPLPRSVPPVEGPRAADPFADLPRITPFTEFELDPLPAEDPGSGRRHRADDVGNDMLARILAREQR